MPWRTRGVVPFRLKQHGIRRARAVCRRPRRHAPAAALVLVLGLPSAGGAALLEVGPGREFMTVGAAARAAGDGDLVIIHEGVYREDYATWRQNDLTILGEGEVRIVAGDSPIPNGKAIWIVRGLGTRIVNVSFEQASVRDRNGAGIRFERGSLIVERCRFVHNEMGLLTAAGREMSLTIRDSVFGANTQDYRRTGALGHNVYVGKIGIFEISGSEIFAADTGHNIKTRARESRIVDNRIYDTPEHPASYLIDAPNGGRVVIENNLLIQGNDAENLSMISYGAEGDRHADNALVVVGNTFVNQNRFGIGIINHVDDVAPVVTGNTFEGVTLRYLGGRPLALARFVERLWHRRSAN